MRSRSLQIAFNLAILTLLVPSAMAQVSVKATSTAIIEQNGPKQGGTSLRYFNVEGKDKGKYSCYGLVQFDAKSMLAAIKKASPNGTAKLKQVRLDLVQSIASFSASGSVRVYYVPGAPDPKSLKYPFNLDQTAKAKALADLKFTVAAAAKSSSRAPHATAIVDKCVLSATVNANDLERVLASSPVLTLALVETSPGVAATWAGKAHQSLPPPTLVLTLAK